jgi:hypothetical protein
MKINIFRTYCAFLVIAYVPVWAEEVHFGNYTAPGIITSDLVIIGGSLSLKDSCTVNGDLKVIGGSILMVSDNNLATTVDLYVRGDLLVTNTNMAIPFAVVDATINVQTGKVVVEGDIVTKSLYGSGAIVATYGVQAQSIETYGITNATIYSELGSINAGGAIVTKSDGAASIQAGNSISSPAASYDIIAGSISTRSTTADATIQADGSINVNGAICTNADTGLAWVQSNGYYPGSGIKAQSIFTNAYSHAYVYRLDNGSSVGYIDVKGDLVTSSSVASAFVSAENGWLKGGNIATVADGNAFVYADVSIDVKGNIATKSNTGDATVEANSGTIQANNIMTYGGTDGYIHSAQGITAGRIVAQGISDVTVIANAGNIDVLSITTESDQGAASISANSGGITCKETVSARSNQGSARVAADGTICAASIFTQAAGSANIFSSSGDVIVGDAIKTKSFSNDASIEAGGITARSISVDGDMAYIDAADGAITVDKDIVTHALGDSGYVWATGNISAQKIHTEVPDFADGSIQSFNGVASFELVPTVTADNLTVNNTTFSFDSDYVWNTQLTLQGNCTINGNGHLLTFGPQGQLFVDSGATLVVNNIQLDHLSSDAVTCADNTSTLSVHDVLWTQDANCTFGAGTIFVSGNFEIQGPGTTFQYDSQNTCTIFTNSTWLFGDKVTLNFNSSNQDAILMTDQTSRLEFDAATLLASKNVRFTVGTLRLDNSVIFNAPGGKQIAFGDFVSAHNISYDRRVDAQLTFVGSGTFINGNV